MKLMIASDLHGSGYYVNLLAQRLHEEKPDMLLLLGDLLYHGPRNDLPAGYDTKHTASLLNAMEPKPLCVRGNCDAEVDQAVLDFPILDGTAAVSAEGKRLYLTHGHHLEETARAVASGDVVLFGHTHLPDFTEREGVYYVNPGSVSIPKDGSPHSYLVFENDTFLWKDVTDGEPWREKRI